MYARCQGSVPTVTRFALAALLVALVAACGATQAVVVTAPPVITVTATVTVTPPPTPAPTAAPTPAPTAAPTVAFFVLTGTLSLKVPNMAQYGAGVKPCKGDGGYSDIREGATVTVRDEAGVTIGTGRLSEGALGSNVCVFEFTPIRLPPAEFYSVEVSHRGAITYSQAEMVASGWVVALTLGR